MQQKMSKSESDYSRINLKDNADDILKKLRKQNRLRANT